MSQERIEILKMVSDKVITVEDAERLLRALDDGERKRGEIRRPVGVAARAIDGVSEAISTIGQVVHSTVEDAMEGVEVGLDAIEYDDESGTEVGDSDFEIPAGGRLVVRRSARPGPMGSVELTLVPADGDRCSIEAGEAAEVRT